MMIFSVIVGILSNTYLVLTALKLTQWGLHKWNRNEGMYIPSFSIFMTLFSSVLMGGEMQVSKIPRKDLRGITDKWIEEYHKKVQSRAPKTFRTYNEALNHFFIEFCNDSPFYYVWFVSKTSTPYLNQPLGICTAAQLLLFLLGIPFLILREVVFMGGSPLTVLCKMAAAGTISEVYVVACREGISYEKALHKYPWIGGVFTRPQIHPMIGRAVCPVYKRKVVFPADTMNFDIQVIPNKTGFVVVRQTYTSHLQQLWHDMLPTQLVFGLVVMYLTLLSDRRGEVLMSSVGPYAAVYYSVRMVVDRTLGLEWIDLYRYIP